MTVQSGLGWARHEYLRGRMPNSPPRLRVRQPCPLSIAGTCGPWQVVACSGPRLLTCDARLTTPPSSAAVGFKWGPVPARCGAPVATNDRRLKPQCPPGPSCAAGLLSSVVS